MKVQSLLHRPSQRRGAVARAQIPHGRIEPLEARIAPAMNQWIGGASGIWNLNANWSDMIPTSDDDVIVDVLQSQTVSISATNVAMVANTITILGDDTLTFTNGSLTLGGGPSEIANLGLNGSATVSTSGNLTLSGTSTMASAAVLSGNGKILLTGALSMTGGPEIRTELENTGTMTMTAGTFFLRGATAKVRVFDDGVLNLTGAALQRADGGLGIFIEDGGRLNSVSGNNTANGALFVDGGLVNVTGVPGNSLQFNASASLRNTTFNVAAGTFVFFNGSLQQTAMSGVITGTGAGQVVINGDNSFGLAADTVFNFAPGVLQFQNSAAIDGPGTLMNVGDLNGSPVLKTRVLNTGTFTPAGTLTFGNADAELRILAGGVLESTGLNLVGAGKGLAVESGGVLAAVGGVSINVLTQVLGTVKTGPGILQFIGQTNITGAHFDTTAGGFAVFQPSAVTTLAGTLTGAGGAGTVMFGNPDGTFNIAAGGATLDLAQGMATFTSPTINGPGVLTIASDVRSQGLTPTFRTEVRVEGTLNFLSTNPGLVLDGAGGKLVVADGGLVTNGSNINGQNFSASNGAPGIIIEPGGKFFRSTSGQLNISAPVDNRGTMESAGGNIVMAGAVAQLTGTAGNVALTGGTWIQRANAVLDFPGVGINILGAGTDVTVGSGNTSRFPDILSLAQNNGTLRLIEGQQLLLGTSLTNAGLLTLQAGSQLSTGAFTNTSAGTVEFGIAGTANNQLGRLIGTGAATLAGTAHVVVTAGFDPQAAQSFPLMSFASRNGQFANVEGLNIGHADVFDEVYTGTAFSLLSLVSAADLDVESVTPPGASVAGNDVSFSYTVRNVGAFATPVAAWTDTIYLSLDSVLDSRDIVLARVAHNGAVGPNGTYTTNATVPLVGALPGNYQLIVVADALGRVADTDRANNTVASTGAFALDVTQLTPGAAFIGGIANNRDLYFKVTLPAGETPVFTFAGNVTGQAELYTSLGEMPTRADFDDAAFDGRSAVQRITGDATAAATYFILLHGRENAGAGQNFSLLADGISFDLAASSLASGANIGRVTTTFTGSQFSPATTFALVSGSTTREAAVVYFSSGSQVTATFDLTGLAAASYDIVATDGLANDTLAGGFAVTAGGTPGTLRFNIDVPKAIRPPYNGTAVTLNYANIGQTDLDAPLINLFAENAIVRLADQTGFLEGTYANAGGTLTGVFELLGVSGGLAGVLSPGERGSITVLFQPFDTQSHAKFRFDADIIVPNGSAMNWDELKDDLRPNGMAADAWDAVFANFKMEVGATAASYQAELIESANYLSQFGAVSPDASRLVAFEIQQADDFGLISDRFTTGAFGRGVSAPFSLRATTDEFGNVALVEGALVRGFVLLGDGTYRGTNGDQATLTRGVGGEFTLDEGNGAKTVFRASDGRIDFIEDLNGRRFSAAWNASGQLASVTDSLNGDATTYTHNAQGRIATSTDAVGHVTTYGYDATGEHLTSVATPRGTTTYTYSATGHRVETATGPDGVPTTFAYDARGRLASQTIGSGPDAVALTFTHGAPGLTTTIDAAATETHVFRNALGKIVRSVDALAQATDFALDAFGRVTGITGADGVTALAGYDAAGNIASGDAGDRAAAFFDIGGDLRRLQSVTDPGGDTTSFGYDGRGNLISKLLPDGAASSLEYDAQGRIIAATDANGGRATFTYNAAGLPATRTLADGETVTLGYDVHRNLTTATDSEGTTTFTYDLATDRLTSVAYPNGKTITLTYDAAGRRATISDGSYTVKYSYDALGRLDTVRDGADGLLVDYGFNALGQLATETRSNGATTSYDYDDVGHVESITHRDAANAQVEKFDYAYDARGRIASVASNAGTTNYTYDIAGQLVGAVLPGGRTLAFAYDAEGNRVTTSDSAGATENYTTNNGDQYTAAGGETLSYDREGRIVARSVGGVTTSYRYDSAGRLAGITAPGSVITYDYDALGARIGVVENGVRTDFANDPAGLGTVFGEYAGATATHYANGIGLAARVAAGGAGGALFYHFDAIGNTALLSGAGGASVATYSYLPFGEIAAQTGASAQPFTFGGRAGVLDDAGDLFHMRARTYDAALGRFTSRDPIGFSGGDANLYRFVLNDPVNFNDPSGLILGVDDVALLLTGSLPDAGLAFRLALDAGTRAVGPALTIPTAGAATGSATGLLTSAEGVLASAATGDATGLFVTNSVTLNALKVGVGEALLPLTLSAAAGYAAGTLVDQATDYLFPEAKQRFRDNLQTGINPVHPPTQDVGIYDKDYGRYVQKAGSNFATNFWYKFYIKTGLPPEEALEKARIEQRKTDNEKYRNEHPDPTDGGSGENFRPNDPNNILGPSGAGAEALPDVIGPGQTRFDGFVGAGDAFGYRVEFENKPDAVVPAQVVRVTQTLDADLDFSTFVFTGFGFGDERVAVPAGAIGTSFHTVYDATAARGVLVKIDATLDTLTGALEVIYTSLDPATNDVPLDPFAGFLPPDDASGRGDGFFTYAVSSKAALANGTDFDALASIVFDTENPIATPFITNTLDTLAPTSTVNALPGTTTRSTFAVRSTGVDETGGSGLAGITFFFTDNGGPLQTATVTNGDGGFRFTGEVGHTYAFFSQAADNVGNLEALAATPDATITIVAPTFLDVGKKRVFTDADGDTYTVTYSGKSGSAKVALLDPDGDGKGAIDILQFDGGDAKADAEVTVKRNKADLDGNGQPDGDGIVPIGDVLVNGSLGAFSAKASDLVVNGLTASGTVKKIVVRDLLQPDPILDDPLIALGGTNVDKTTITARNLSSGFAINTPGIVSAIKAAAIGDGTITAAGLKKLEVSKGDLNADIALAGALGAVKIKKGSLTDATITAMKVADLSIAEDLARALILAGADLGADRALGGTGANADTFAAATIGAVQIGRQVIASTIAAGLDPADDLLDNGNDTILNAAVSKIASLTVKGAAGADSYFAAGSFKKMVKIDGAVIDPGNDPLGRFLTV